MKCIILPYGNAGWTRKKSIIESIIASRQGPPYIYNDVLILVPSKRVRRMYGRLFLDAVHNVHGAVSLVQPEIQTLREFFQSLFASLHGPSLIDETARTVLLEGIVKDHLNRFPSFPLSPDLLAPSLSAAIAKTIEQISGAGLLPNDLSVRIQEADFSEKPQVQLLLDVYTRYEHALRQGNLADPAGMTMHLRDNFDPALLASYHTIIIDSIQNVGKLETEIIRKVASCMDCTLLVEAPSSSLLDRAGEYHPLRIVKDLLSDIGIKPERHEGADNPDDDYLASSLFSEKSFAESSAKAPEPSRFSKHINVLSTVNTREEVSLIAREIKKSLTGGTPADLVLVSFPSLDQYGPLVEEVFTDYGIPYNRALGRQLSSSVVATALISLLHAFQEDYSGTSLMRVFSSPFLKFSGNPAIAPVLDRFLRDQRIIGGKQNLLTALKYHQPEEDREDILSRPLDDLFTALEPFSALDTAPLSVWMERLSALTTWSGIGERVSLIKGPLNINLQAYKMMTKTLSDLVRAGNLFSDYRYTFREWLFLVKKTFMHVRFQVPPEDEGGVQVLGLHESLGHPWKEIYIGGLVDGSFPQRTPQNIFLPEQMLETIGVRTLERARLNDACHFYRLLFSAPRVILTHPENEDERPVVRSPFLEELAPLAKANLLNRGREKTSGIQFSLLIEDSRSLPELAKAISLSDDVTGLEKALDADIKGMAGIKSALVNRPAGPMPKTVPLQKRVFWVTELDAYINCPYDYYITNVLNIEPLEEVTEDISPLDRGSKVHAILRNFYLAWKQPVTAADRDTACALLNKLADSAFDGEADTFRNRREKEFFLTVMGQRFLDAEELFWKQNMRPAYLEQKIEFFRLTLSDGTEVEIKAKVDRIDVDKNGNFIIVDYKTGGYPSPKMNVEQDIFQLPVYAVMAHQALSGRDPLLKKPIGLAYYDLKGKTRAGARDVVLYNMDARSDHPSSKPRASAKSSEEFDEILKQAMSKARRAIEAILAGDFPTIPRDDSKCRYCPNEVLCREEES